MTLAAGARLGPTKSWPPSAPAAWAKSTGRATRGCGATSRSKCCRSRFPADVDRLRRFEQEARAAAALNHPNILAVYDIGTDGRRAVYRVGAARRRDAARAAADGRRPGAQGRRLRRRDRAGTGGGARERHRPPRSEARESVHHDDDRVKILDFGLAKLTERSRRRGRERAATTPRRHAAGTSCSAPSATWRPSRCAAFPSITGRTSVRSGAVLYEMLSGARAFRGDTAPDTMTAILKEDPPDLLARPNAASRRRSRGSSIAASRRARRRVSRRPAISRSRSDGLSGAVRRHQRSRRSRTGRRDAWLAWSAAALLAAALALSSPPAGLASSARLHALPIRFQIPPGVEASGPETSRCLPTAATWRSSGPARMG